jgi:hypothetical protein
MEQDTLPVKVFVSAQSAADTNSNALEATARIALFIPISRLALVWLAQETTPLYSEVNMQGRDVKSVLRAKAPRLAWGLFFSDALEVLS